MSAELKITRPLIRWHGGKFNSARWIVPGFPRHRKYREAYGGGGNILLLKQRVFSEVYNDLGSDVYTLFCVARDPVTKEQLKQALYYTPYSREEFDNSYLPTRDPIETARRLVVRAFMGFSSSAHNAKAKTGFRGKSERSNTTPAHDWVNYPNCLDAVCERLRGVVLENLPALEILQKYDDEDALHYLDPTYVKSARHAGENTEEYEFEMSDDDHRELARVVKMVKGMVVISGYPTDLYDQELYPDWFRVEHKVTASGSAGGSERTEVLWLNAAAVRNRSQRGLFD